MTDYETGKYHDHAIDNELFHSLVNQDIFEDILSLFGNYQYFDLCRTVFCINAWRGNRSELEIAMTLNNALLYCDKTGEQKITTYSEFEKFFDEIKKYCQYNAFADEAVPDWGEVFISFDNGFYPVLLGNGYNYVFATMQCIPTVARLSKHQDLIKDVLIYVKNMIASLTSTNIYNDCCYGDLFEPSASFFEDVCQYYNTLSVDNVPRGISFLLLNPDGVETAHFSAHESHLYPLFNASILVDAYTKLLSDIIEKFPVSQHIIYDTLLFSHCLDGKSTLLRNARGVTDINNLTSINDYTDGILISQENFSILFVDETRMDRNTLFEYRNTLLNMHDKGELIIAGVNTDKKGVGIPIDKECNFEVVSFDQMINCGGEPVVKGLFEGELYRFMALELVYCIVSADSIDELFNYFHFTLNNKIQRTFAFDGRCAEFEVWKQNAQQIVPGALDVALLSFELYMPEYSKWEKYRTIFSKFYPTKYSELFAYPENWMVECIEHEQCFIKNRAIKHFSGYLSKIGNASIFIILGENMLDWIATNTNSIYKHSFRTILDLLNKGLFDITPMLIKHNLFRSDYDFHIYLQPSGKNEVGDFPVDKNSYCMGKSFCDDNVMNVLCFINFDKIIRDLQSATDKSIECQIMIDFLKSISLLNNDDIETVVSEIAALSFEKRDFALKPFKIDYYFSDANYVIYPDNISFAAVVKRIAKLCLNANINPGIYSGIDATKIIRKMQESLVLDFEDEIRKYSRTDLHKKLLSRLAAFIFEKNKDGLTYVLSPENIANNMKAITEEIASNSREKNKFNIRTISYLEESNLFLERESSVIATDTQIDYLIAFADWLVVLQDNSDSNRWNIISDKIEVEYDYRVMTVNDKDDSERQKQHLKRYYANNDYKPVDTPNDKEWNEIFSGISVDIGIPFDKVLLVLRYLENEFLFTFENEEVEKDVFVVKKDKLLDDMCEVVKERTDQTKFDLSNALDFLTIDALKIKTTIKKDGSEYRHEILPIWEREKRWNRLDIKPIVTIGKEVCFSPILIHETKEMWLQGLSALYPPVEANLHNMEAKLKAISKRCQKQMESDVAALFCNESGRMVEAPFEFRTRQKGKNHEDVGDYDVLCIDVCSKIIWNIECKFIHKVANIFEVANQQKGFFEQNKYHEKFQRRISYLEKHLQDLFDVLEVKDDIYEYSINNYMVTNKLFEAIDRELPFEIITYNELSNKI